jgi:hypothetical protein
LEPQPTLAPRNRVFDFIHLCKRREQSLRLGDLRHFRRGRERFERRREDGVGVQEASGRLIELGE